VRVTARSEVTAFAFDSKKSLGMREALVASYAKAAIASPHSKTLRAT
jgi:hypothetical protein